MSKISDERLAELIRYFELRDPSTSHELATDTEEALVELRALRSGGEEKNGEGVKPLEWSNGGKPHTVAECVLGVYSINLTSGGRYQLNRNFKTPADYHPTLEAAKAAAQADYERRILSALTNTDLSLRAENERLHTAYRAENKAAVLRASAAVERADRLQAKLEEAAKVLADVRDHTDPDNPESYRSDDREGCSDTVHSISKSFLSNLKGAE